MSNMEAVTDYMLPHIRYLPNIFILGARRAGTASLAHYLGQHPAIRFTEPFDPEFFLKKELYQRGLDYYIQNFCHPSAQPMWLGEASATYFANPHLVGPRLRAQYGDMPLKFIVLLREPVARAWSHYLARVHHGVEKRNFATALAQEEQDSQDTPENEARYFAEGCYLSLLNEWQSYYPLDHFQLLLSEDLAANPLTQVRRIFTWLDAVTDVPINVSERLNVARYSRNPRMVDFLNHPPAWLRSISKQMWPEGWQRRRVRHQLRERFQKAYPTLPPLDPAIATELRQRYRGEILALSKLLGRYLSHWLAEENLADVTQPQMAY